MCVTGACIFHHKLYNWVVFGGWDKTNWTLASRQVYGHPSPTPAPRAPQSHRARHEGDHHRYHLHHPHHLDLRQRHVTFSNAEEIPPSPTGVVVDSWYQQPVPGDTMQPLGTVPRPVWTQLDLVQYSVEMMIINLHLQRLLKKFETVSKQQGMCFCPSVRLSVCLSVLLY